MCGARVFFTPRNNVVVSKKKQLCEQLYDEYRIDHTYSKWTRMWDIIETMTKYWKPKKLYDIGNDRCCICGEWAAGKGCSYRYEAWQDPEVYESPPFKKSKVDDIPSYIPVVYYLCDPCSSSKATSRYLGCESAWRVND